MAEGNEDWDEIEPSFNIDDWMNELLPDDIPDGAEFGEGVEPLPPPVSSSNASSVDQNNTPIKLDESHINVGSNMPIKLDESHINVGSKTECFLANSLITSTCPNPKPIDSASGSSSGNFARQNMSSTASVIYYPFPTGQNTSGSMVSQLTAQSSNIYPLPVHCSSSSSSQRQPQPLLKQNFLYGMLPQQLLLQQQQQQQRFGNQSGSFVMNDQELLGVLQHPDPLSSQKRVMQQLSPLMQMNQPLNTTSYFDAKSKLPESGFVPPSLSRNEPQLVHFDRWQAYNAQVRAVNSSSDWVEPLFQQIQFLKEMYISDVIRLLDRSRDMRDQASTAELVAKHEKTRSFTERVVNFLQISRADLVMNYSKDRAMRIVSEVSASLGRMVAQRQAPLQHPLNHFVTPEIQPKMPQTPHRGHFIQYNVPNQFQISASMPLRQQSILNMQKLAANSFLVGPDGSRTPDVSALVNSGLSSLDSSLTSLAQSSNFSAARAKKALEDPSMQMQKFKQPLQQYLAEKNKQQMLQRLKDDANLGHILGFNRKMCSLGFEQPYHAPSPQNSQHSSARVEQKDKSSVFSNSVAVLPSTPSPAVIPPPLTPLTPSSVTVDSGKSPSRFFVAPALESHLQKSNHSQLVAPETAGFLKSPWIAVSSSPSAAVKLPSAQKESPFKRLVEVVKSMSSSTLKDSLREIHACINMANRTGGEYLNREAAAGIIVRDLADDIRNYQNGNFCLVDGTVVETRMQRQPNAVNIEGLTSERELDEDSRRKRMKIEPSLHAQILQEIKETNQNLIEVHVSVVNAEDTLHVGAAGGGILIRCCYKPVGIAFEPGSSQETFPTLLLDLIVDAAYPSSSPLVLESLPPNLSGDEKGKDLWMKAKSSFSLWLRKRSHPLSVKEMAKTWGVCAREVFLEFARQRGGGSLSSKYGEWEDPITLFSAS